MTETTNKVLLEGRPGTGKTTLARAVVDALRDRGLEVTGITTEELREGRRRVGFSVEAIAGAGGTLAHVDFPGPPRVGKYGVDLETFERIALPALRSQSDVVVIDELGKMELASSAFCSAVEEIMGASTPVLATVHVFEHPFTDALKARPDVERIRLTRANRDALVERVLATLNVS